MILRAGRAAVAAAGACLLAACATPPPTGGDWISGRLQVKVDATASTPSRNVTSAFDLRGDGDAGELRLNTPLGTRVATAIWAPGSARLSTSDGERRYADLDELARDALGEPLPLRALPAWLRGRPWAGTDSRATAAGFEQLGWQVSTTRLADEGLVEASRNTPPAVTVRARLEKTE